MLTHRALPSAPRHARGFTLVEMMVAMVLGLLVVAAVLAFIFSLIRANSETVLSTRLNQEMRSTMALISSDIRRARGLADPIAAIGTGGVVNPYSAIDVSTANCMRYSYSESPGGTTDYRAIRLDSDSGKVVLVRASTAAGATCDTAGTVLNTDGVVITDLSFSNPTARRVNVQLTGRLRNPPAYMSSNPSQAVSAKTIRQTISIRSNGA